MRKIFIKMVVAAAALIAVSCSKEAKDVQTFKASAEQATDNTKISLSGLQLRWSAGDQISVYDNSSNAGIYALSSGEGTNNGEFAYSSGSSVSAAPFSAVYPAAIRTGAATVSLPAVQHSADGGLQELPMYAVGDDMELKFHHLCGVVRFRLRASSAVSVSRITVATDRNTNGAATVSGSGLSVTLSTPSGSNVTTLSCEYGQSISSAHDFYMYLPAGTYSTFRILFTAADGSICSKSANTGITVERGKITTITLSNLTFTAHRFSVSNSTSVVFSPGNLQYQASTGTWRFATNQYDYIGSDNANISSSNSGWIDLFGWGTSGWNSGANCYQPWSTSTNYVDYCPGGAYATNNLTGTYARADWGVNNAISNGGNAAGLWRTMTRGEWDYLFFSRTGCTTVGGISNGRYALALVNGVGGVIVFPDSYTHPTGVAAPHNVNENNPSESWGNNSYSTTEWNAMQIAGAVFLPPSGWRIGTSIDNVGLVGEYWVSSYRNVGSVWMGGFSNHNLSIGGSRSCYFGLSVRLVRD